MILGESIVVNFAGLRKNFIVCFDNIKHAINILLCLVGAFLILSHDQYIIRGSTIG